MKLTIQIDQPRDATVPELVEILAGGQPVVTTSGRRSHLTSALKRAGIFTRYQTLRDGRLLFSPSKPRKFK